jgi:hypothetical protein
MLAIHTRGGDPLAKRHQRPLADTPRPTVDARSAPRTKFVQFLWFQDLEATSGSLARSIDISDTGVGFVASHEVGMGARIFLILLTPFGRISSIARVVHCSKAGEGSFRIGVRLEIVPPTDKAAWATLVEKEAR